MGHHLVDVLIWNWEFLPDSRWCFWTLVAGQWCTLRKTWILDTQNTLNGWISCKVRHITHVLNLSSCKLLIVICVCVCVYQCTRLRPKLNQEKRVLDEGQMAKLYPHTNSCYPLVVEHGWLRILPSLGKWFIIGGLSTKHHQTMFDDRLLTILFRIDWISVPDLLVLNVGNGWVAGGCWDYYW